MFLHRQKASFLTTWFISFSDQPLEICYDLIVTSCIIDIFVYLHEVLIDHCYAVPGWFAFSVRSVCFLLLLVLLLLDLFGVIQYFGIKGLGNLDCFRSLQHGSVGYELWVWIVQSICVLRNSLHDDSVLHVEQGKM